MRRHSWLFAQIIAAVVLVLVLGTRAVARKFVFRAQGVRLAHPPDDVIARDLVGRDGVRIRTYELPAPPAGRTVVHFHNNRETALDSLDLARALRAAGMGVLLVEYRGYGASEATEPSEEGIYADAEAALDMLEARGVHPDRVVLSGTSLGTGVAAEMARRGRGARLVLMSPYTSIPDLVRDAAPFVPARLLVPDQFDTAAKAGEIAFPTLVIHGDADEIVPFRMGAELAATFPAGRLLRVQGGHHGDLFARERERLIAAIAELASR